MTRKLKFGIVALIGLLMAFGASHIAGFWKTPYNRPVAAPPVLGQPLAPDELGPGWRFVVEAAWGASLTAPSASWAWFDITGDVLQADGRLITISPMGAQDENQRTPSAGCAFTLDNRSGAYSKNNAYSPNWPNVRSNTPIRVRVTNDNGAIWYVFFQGEATVWQPDTDETGRFQIVNVTAKGRMQRLNQHSEPLRSAMERGISTQALGGGRKPIAYYPFEDKANATGAANVAAPGSPGIVSPIGGVTWASVSGVGGSDSFAAMSSGTQATGTIPTGQVGAWRVERLFTIPPTPAADTTLLSWTTLGGTGNAWRLQYHYDATNPHISLECRNAAGTELIGDTGIFKSYLTSNFGANFNMFGTPMFIVVDVAQDGTGIDVSTTIYNVAAGNGTGSLKTVAGFTLGTLHSWLFAPDANLNGGAIGHLAFFDSNYATGVAGIFVDWDSNYLNGYTGESPVARMFRLCNEEGIEFQQVGSYDQTVSMGPQGIMSFMDLMWECAVTEDGFLYDGVSAGLTYQPPSQRYNQLTAITLDASLSELQKFTPLDDDLKTINRASVAQKNGSTSTAEQVTGYLGTGAQGIGDVDTQVTINAYDASTPLTRANWEVWKGTVGGFRYPLVPLNLRRKSTVAQRFMARTDGLPGPVVPGSRLDLLNAHLWSAQLPVGTAPLMIEGWTIRLSRLVFEVDLICTPNRRYDVWRIGDTNLGRLNATNSYLVQPAAAGASSLLVATQAGSQLWSTAAGDYPSTAEVDGIPVTVTAVASVASDGFTRTVAAGWGTADSGQAWTVTGTAAQYSVGSGWGQQAIAATGVEYCSLLDIGSTDHAYTVDVNFPMAAGVGSLVRVRVGGRAIDQNNLYLAQLELDTSGTMRLLLARRSGGTSTTTVAAVVLGTHTAGDWWRVTFSAIGSTVSATAQDVTTLVNPQTLSVADTSSPMGTQIALMSTITAGWSGTLPQTIAWDHLTVSNPQVFTVTGATVGKALTLDRPAVQVWHNGAIRY